MKNENWFKWYPGRFKADTMHLSVEEEGIYRRLIDHYMETAQPLSNNLQALARIAGVTVEHIESCWPVLSNFFQHGQNEKLHLKLCDELIKDRAEKTNRLKETGKLGGKSRALKHMLKQNSSEPQANAQADKIRLDKIDISKDISPPIVPLIDQEPQNGSLPKKPKTPKGTKLNEWLAANGPSSGAIPPEWIEWIDRKYGWDDQTINHVAERFWRYFTGPDAKNPRKNDWRRAFQNWCDGDLSAAQAFIRSRSGAFGNQDKGYSGAVADSTKQALNLIDAGFQSAGDDAPEFHREGSE